MIVVWTVGRRTRTCAAVAGALLALGTFAAEITAQSNERARTWLALGVGAGLLDGADPAALLLQFGVLREGRFFAARGSLLSEAGTGYDAYAWDFGVVIGRGLRGRFGHAALAAGISLAGCDNPREIPKCSKATTLGIPVVAEAAVRMLPFLGLGVQAFGNINTRTIFGGGAAFFQFGALRR